MTGGVDEMEDVTVPLDTNILGLDGDAPLTLKIHRIEILGFHISCLHRTRDLKNSIGQRRFPMINVGDNREISDAGKTRCGVHGCPLRYRPALGVFLLHR